MKKSIYVLGMAVALFACKQEAAVDYALVSGKIENKDGDFKMMSQDQTFSQDIAIAEDGTFADTLRVDAGTYMFFDGKNFAPVYIENGSNIVINADVSDFKNSITFSGKGSEVTNYITAKGKSQTELMGEGTSVYELEEDAYKAKASEIKTASETLLDAATGISDDYKAKEKRSLNYAYLGLLNRYERYHAHYAKKPEFKASEGFLDELGSVDYNNEEDFEFSQDYKQMVMAHYGKKAQDLMASDSLAYDIAQLNTFAAIENQNIKNELLFSSAQNSITYTNDVEGYYAAYMAASTDEENNAVITESYNKLLTVSKGKPSPKFVNYENYAGGTTSLDDLKGKYVYVDVWATWCGPCKAEIPFLKEVEKSYHGKNIEFVSLSVDRPDAYDAWRNMIKEKELGGIQLLADKNFDSQFVQDYLIKGIPRFILIDPNGDIVNSNAPRPSNKKLVELFQELNI